MRSLIIGLILAFCFWIIMLISSFHASSTVEYHVEQLLETIYAPVWKNSFESTDLETDREHIFYIVGFVRDTQSGIYIPLFKTVEQLQAQVVENQRSY